MDKSQPDLVGQQKLQFAFQQYQMGNVSQAEAEYRKILTEHPSMPETYQYLAIALMDQKQADEAIECLETGLSKWPQNPHLLTTITSAYSSVSNLDKALDYARKTVTLFPLEPDVQYNYAGLLMAKGFDYDALEAYTTVLKLKPNLAIAHYNIGCIRYKFGEKELARDEFNRASVLDENLLAALNNLGQVYCELENYEEAISPLEKVLAKEPKNLSANKQLGMAHHFLGDLDVALKYFLTTLDNSEENTELDTLVGNVYRDMGNYEKAIDHYQKALRLDESNEMARKNLSKLQGGKLAAWHAQMLADGKRNQAYDRAIRKAVTEKTKVLDIGAGSGLLSLMAARAGSKQITACEMTPIMAEIAEKVVVDNGYADIIAIHNIKSSDMEVGKELEEKVDIIISEILDMSVLGEGVIPAMRHAKEHFLSEGGAMIPQSASLFGMLIETEYSHHLHPLKHLEGFDLSAMADFLETSTFSRIVLEKELHKELSDVFPVLSFDFMNTGPRITEVKPKRESMRITATAPGVVQGVAFWFHLNLDKEIVVTTAPHGDMIHWGQAMCYFNQTIKVKEGDQVSIDVVHHDTAIWFEPSIA